MSLTSQGGQTKAAAGQEDEHIVRRLQMMKPGLANKDYQVCFGTEQQAECGTEVAP
jgi:hypothetical protein